MLASNFLLSNGISVPSYNTSSFLLTVSGCTFTSSEVISKSACFAASEKNPIPLPTFRLVWSKKGRMLVSHSSCFELMYSSAFMCGGGEIRTHGTLWYSCFQDRCDRPLCHP